MRHFLGSFLGPVALSRRMLACADARALVLRTRATKRLAPPNRTALTRAVDLTVIAGLADHDLQVATRAAKLSVAVDHPSRDR